MWRNMKAYWNSPDFEKVSKLSSACCSMQNITFNLYAFGVEIGLKIGAMLLSNLNNAVFTTGSWVNPGYGGCKGLVKNPLHHG